MHSLVGVKRGPNEAESFAPRTKRAKPLLFSDDGQAHDGLTSIQAHGSLATDDDSALQINAEFARKFEHNKRREELHRLQEKFGKGKLPQQTHKGVVDSETDESSDSEDEDDEGVLVSADVDAQIQETLEAIRSKDPRVYDKNAAFFSNLEVADETSSPPTEPHVHRPIYLDEYHRQNLMGDAAVQETDTEPYVQQQENLKADIRHKIHVAAPPRDTSEHDDFLLKKDATFVSSEQEQPIQSLDVERADEDPDAFLSTFMATRAWLPHEQIHPMPFESDDEEDDRQAEAFEAAYNLRFEDPQRSNEKLVSHARDIVARHSVRKDHLNPRKRARIIEREKKDTERQNQQDERRRLKRLKQAETTEKLQKIRDAAGFRGDALGEEDWAAFLAENWDNDHWEQHMQKRFDHAYYAHEEDGCVDGKASGKPKWNEEIEIGDIVPDFAENDTTPDRGDTDRDALDEENKFDGEIGGKRTSHNESKRAIRDHKREVRRERQRIEDLVDEKLEVDKILTSFGKKHQGNFRYRETSPVTFGMTPADILSASDSQLNQFAGLKKLATFRDPEKKRKDRKRLGKKARLREWRKDAFGEKETVGNLIEARHKGQ